MNKEIIIHFNYYQIECMFILLEIILYSGYSYDYETIINELEQLTDDDPDQDHRLLVLHEYVFSNIDKFYQQTTSTIAPLLKDNYILTDANPIGRLTTCLSFKKIYEQ